jgi:photosystem II stability/assembly factor-like uncharacterized protein
MQRRIVPALVACVVALGFASVSRADGAPYGDLKWRSIGPAMSGGRVAAVAGTDADPFLYYAGAAGGGVWRSIDAGASWTAAMPDLPVNAIGALAIAPSDKNTVWVGTGESWVREDASYGDGVWMSSDGGTHWQHRGLEATSQISRILIDVRDPKVVLVGALGDPSADSDARGLYRTTDGGATWTKTLRTGPSSGISDIAWNPQHANVVFAGVWQFRRRPWEFVSGGGDGGLYRSLDGGVTWTKLEGHGLPAGITGRIGIAVAPSDAKRVYALIESREGVLWRSDDGGDTWVKTSDDRQIDQRPFYFSRLTVDPQNADHVIALSEYLQESKDGGHTFAQIGKDVHVDHHDLWWSADGHRMIEGDDGGVASSFDGGVDWNWPGNLPVGQIYHIGYDMRVPYDVCGGLQDNTTFCGPSNSLDPEGVLNRDWMSVNWGDGEAVWPDPLDSSLIWNDIENGVLGIFDLRSQQFVDVSPYTRDISGTPAAGMRYRFAWDAPIAFSPQDPHVAYVGGNVLFASRDRGRHWKAISPDLTLDDKTHQQTSGGPILADISGAEYYDTIADIAPSRVRAGVIWTGADDGLIQLTQDGGAHWKNVSVSGIAPYGAVRTVEASPWAAGTAFAAIDRHLLGDRAAYLFVTEDYGAHWRSIAAGLPAQYAWSIRQDPRDPSLLYAGLEQSIWISFDRGASWQSLKLNLPAVSIRDIRVQPQADDLIIGTHGRSLFVLDDLTPLQQLAKARSARTFLFPLRPAYSYWTWTREDAQSNLPAANTFAGDNPDVGALVSYYLSAVAAHPAEIEIVDARGRTVRRFAGTHSVDGKDKPLVAGDAGINRFVWNLTAEPPVKRTHASASVQGPDDGASVVPGTYSVVMRVDGRTLRQPVRVLPDPRATWTQADYVARYDFYAALYGELSQMDTALNEMDALQPKLEALVPALKNKNAPPVLIAQAQWSQARLIAIEADMTSSPHSLDETTHFPDRLRERILWMTGSQLAFSQQPPFAAHRAEAADMRTEFDRLMAEYAAFKREMAEFEAALKAGGYGPI